MSNEGWWFVCQCGSLYHLVEAEDQEEVRERMEVLGITISYIDPASNAWFDEAPHSFRYVEHTTRIPITIHFDDGRVFESFAINSGGGRTFTELTA